MSNVRLNDESAGHSLHRKRCSVSFSKLSLYLPNVELKFCLKVFCNKFYLTIGYFFESYFACQIFCPGYFVADYKSCYQFSKEE